MLKRYYHPKAEDVVKLLGLLIVRTRLKLTLPMLRLKILEELSAPCFKFSPVFHLNCCSEVYMAWIGVGVGIGIVLFLNHVGVVWEC